jgi:3-oxoacyl-[acyl-carrier protein] reductase
MFDLSGKSALVTGASGGIGGAISRQLHGAGANVGLSGTRVDALQAVAEDLGDRCAVLPCDLSDGEAVAALIGRADEAFGALGGEDGGGAVDIVVNNAGLTRDNLALRLKDEDWEQVMAVNLTAAFRLSRAALRGMMKRRWGRIVNITSIVGVTGNGGQTNYAASKAGIIGFSKSLAQEVASRNITVNCLAPGFIQTPMTDALDEKQREALLAGIPARRLGVVDDIAAGALYLASDEAAYITGQTLHINGGMAMI